MEIFLAAKAIQSGNLVAFPTETVYGLGANAFDAKAVANIFATKGRPADNPVIVHVSDSAMLKQVVEEVPPIAQKLMAAFWPGPLTILLKKSELVPDIVTAGSNLVAVREPNHPMALELIQASGVPIAAPSANRSGRPSPTTADFVRNEYPQADFPILDGGATQHGIESTVIDLSTENPQILRPGAITKDMIEKVLGMPISQSLFHGEVAPKSPGTKYQHYQPNCPVIAIAPERWGSDLDKSVDLEGKVGTIAWQNDWPKLHLIQVLAVVQSEEDYARQLYSILLRADELGLDYVLLPLVEDVGLGNAINDRLSRAASQIWS